MPSWSSAAAPPAGHGGATTATTVEWDGKLVLIGGHDGEAALTLVSAYDPDANSWETLGNLSTGSSGGLRGAVIGDTAYWVTSSGLRWVDLTDMTEGSDDGPAGYNASTAPSLHAVGEKLYWLGPTQQVYDPNAGSWASTAQADTTVQAPSTACDGNVIYLAQPGMAGHFLGRYDPATDSWEELTPFETEAAVINAHGHVFNDKVYFVGGLLPVNPFTSLNQVLVYDVTLDSWSVGEPLPFDAGDEGSFNGEALEANRVTHIYAVTLNNSTLESSLPALPLEVEAWVDVSVSVELPVVTTDAYVTISVDVAGGTAVTADVTISFNTGRVVYATAPIVVHVEETPSAWTPPAISAPEGNNAVIQPREWTDCEAPRTGDVCNSDEYSVDWRVGGQASGSVKSFGVESNPMPEPGLNLEAEYDQAIEWRYGDATTLTRTHRQTTVETASSTLLPELMPTDQLDLIPGLTVGGCLKPVTATLCSDTDIVVACLAQDLLPAILPTRVELAHAAAQAANVELFVLNGLDGLPQWGEPVSVEYRTEGKTLAAVLQELLLVGGAPHWYAPGAVFVNGGGLPAVTFTRPTVLGEAGSVTLDAGQAFEDPEPLLADYTADCHESSSEDDPCDGESFETAASGTLTFIEKAGSGDDYTEVRTTLRKENGQIVQEDVVKFGIEWQIELDVTQPGNLSGVPAVVPKEWHRRTFTYLACCPQALTHSTEYVWAAPSNTDPNATFMDAFRVRLNSFKSVTQRWHAEGWLASRIEASGVQHGYRVKSGGLDPNAPGSGVTYNVIPTYKVATRTETYTPVGRGLWYVNIGVSENHQMPVGDGNEDDEQILGSIWGSSINTWTQVTDQAPPQVSCGSELEDPCGSGDCVTDRTAEWQADHDAWAAKSAAWVLNNPAERVVTTVTYPGRVLLQPGVVRDEGLVAGVSWAGASVRTGRPGESTTVEYWGVNAS